MSYIWDRKNAKRKICQKFVKRVSGLYDDACMKANTFVGKLHDILNAPSQGIFVFFGVLADILSLRFTIFLTFIDENTIF